MNLICNEYLTGTLEHGLGEMLIICGIGIDDGN